MRRSAWLVTCITILAGPAGALTAQDAAASRPTKKAYRVTDRWEKAIARFEARDRKSPPPVGAVVCIGSSSMGGWHRTIRRDLAPLTVIPRGFGGSTMNDALRYADRIVIPYKPRAVLLYEGDNDTAAGISPATVRDTFGAFVAKLRDSLPKVRVYVLAVKPSPRRWSKWPAVKKTNELLAAACAKDERLTFIDIATPMLGDDGEPLPDIFKKDRLHMNAKGYAIWTRVVRPILVGREAKAERPAAAGASR